MADTVRKDPRRVNCGEVGRVLPFPPLTPALSPLRGEGDQSPSQTTLVGNRLGRRRILSPGFGGGQVRERAVAVTGTLSGCGIRSCRNRHRFSFTISGSRLTCEFQNRLVTIPRDNRYRSFSSSRLR